MSTLSDLLRRQAKHRRMRRWDVLWSVHTLAVQWRALAKRREVRMRSFETALGRAATDEERDAISSCITALQEAQSAEVCSLWPPLRVYLCECASVFVGLCVARARAR